MGVLSLNAAHDHAATVDVEQGSPTTIPQRLIDSGGNRRISIEDDIPSGDRRFGGTGVRLLAKSLIHPAPLVQIVDPAETPRPQGLPKSGQWFAHLGVDPPFVGQSGMASFGHHGPWQSRGHRPGSGLPSRFRCSWRSAVWT
ncbi:hypothetical protein ACFFX0_31145 [Citricoccus parietis]|uniref:Uncharacterized protein n=1 Tax=Citricoccus parietis TaxID=592307 RepID=A0ABV5G904_9MICC